MGGTLSIAAEPKAPLGLGQVVILVGPPGSGKSTQAEKLSKRYRVPSISVSDLIKQQMKQGGPLTGTAKAQVATGELLDDDGANQLISGRVAKGDVSRGFILDGYPATEAQAQFLDELIAKNGLMAPKVVVLEVPDAVARERMQRRKRSGDDSENIERRLADYHKEDEFLAGWYKRENSVRVDATQSVDAVFQSVERSLIDLFAKQSFQTREKPGLQKR